MCSGPNQNNPLLQTLTKHIHSMRSVQTTDRGTYQCANISRKDAKTQRTPQRLRPDFFNSQLSLLNSLEPPTRWVSRSLGWPCEHNNTFLYIESKATVKVRPLHRTLRKNHPTERILSMRSVSLVRISNNRNPQLSQLLLRNKRGGSHHQVFRTLIHREQNHFAYVRLICQQHHDSIHPRS